MKNILTLIFICSLIIANAQSTKTRAALKSIGEYEVDDHGNVTFVRIVELDSMLKDEIFNRAEEYFTYHYGHGESVLQVNDRAQGRLLGKGKYTNTAWVIGLLTYKLGTWHILKIEVKDGKARLTLSLTEYDVESRFDGSSSFYTATVSKSYPVDPKGPSPNAFGQGFAESYKRAMASLDELEKSLREGATFSNTEKDW